MANTLKSSERSNRKRLIEELNNIGKHQCSKCLEIKDLSEFTPYGSRMPGRPYPQCKACKRDSANQHSLKKSIERKKQYHNICILCDAAIEATRIDSKFCSKEHGYFVRQVAQYGGSLNDAKRVFNQNQCEVCKSKEKLCIDHHHYSNRLRGRLCHGCNTGLGYFFESESIIQNAIKYLNNQLNIPDLPRVENRTHCRWCNTNLTNPHYNRKFCSISCKKKAALISGQYNMSVEQYKWLLNFQENKCACCRKQLIKPVIDHNHDTNKIRGILCDYCNIGIGQVKNNTKILSGLIQYLDNYKQDEWEDWTVQSINNKLSRSIAVEKHYLHRNPNVSFGFGLFYQNNLKGICTFGTPSSQRITKSVCPDDPKSVLELNRLWLEDDCPKFAESWFISRCLKQLPARIIISYADTGIYDEHNKRYHDGTIYRALNFNWAGKSKASTDWRIPGKTRNVGKNTEGSVAVAVPPKNRYWILTGNKREKDQLRKICNWPSLKFTA